MKRGGNNVLRKGRGKSGTTWNRTRDTRIFSPLLYHLSYGTFAKRGANIKKTFYLQNAHLIFISVFHFHSRHIYPGLRGTKPLSFQ